MELLDLFYKWVPLYLRLPVLFLIFFVVLVANGIYLGNATEMYSDMGVYAEQFTEAYNAIYIGMGLGLIFHMRLKMRFSNKTLLLCGLTVLLVMNLICATTSNATVIIAACFILGFAKISAMVEVYVIWMYIWSKKLDTSRMYPFVYFTALAGIHFVTWLTTWLAYQYNWRFAYIAILALILLCLISALLLVENHPPKKKYPLYQVDYLGLTQLSASMLLLNYAMVNGKVEDWFSSGKIIAALLGSLAALLLFLKREYTIKRPMFDLGMFKKSNFSTGLAYFMILGLFIPGTFQSAFSGGILHYEMITNMEVNLYMIPGIIAGCLVCYVWYYFNLDGDLLIIAGFACFILYHIMMYNSFTANFDIHGFWQPSAAKGFATAVLYISVGLYTTRSMGINMIMSAAGTMILFRSFIGSGICSAFYVYFLYEQRIRHLDYLAGQNDGDNYISKVQGTSYYANIQQQATLAASKELTGYIIIAGLLFIGFLVTKYLCRKLGAVLVV